MSSPSRSAKTRRKGRSQASLGTRLTLLLLPLVLIPFLLMAGGAYFRARDILKQQANAQMISAVEGQINSLNEWVFARQTRLFVGSERPELRFEVAQLLDARSGTARDRARTILEELRFQRGEELFGDLLIARRSPGGEILEVLVATNPEWEGKNLPAISGAVSEDVETIPIHDLPDVSPTGLGFLTYAPLFAKSEAAPDSVLVGVNSGSRVGALVEDMQIFWEERGVYRIERGQTYMLMDPETIIELPRYGTAPIVTTGISHPILQTSPSPEANSLEFTNSEGQAVLGAYQWIPAWKMAVVVELPQELAFSGLNTLAYFTIALLLGTILLVAIVVPWASRRSLRPLGVLARIAERFASGNLRERVAFDRRDEIGRLGEAFNYMADELSQLYRSLENRVQQRTKEIILAAEVAKDAATIENLDQLLQDTAELIANRFDYYHVGIFLVDSAGEFANLRAASSEGGRRMLQKGHKLAVGETGIVGFVTGSGKPRTALDVGEDAVHFANPDLPETRSEMAVPIKVSGKTIGALDIQSERVNAFSEADLVVLQMMSDQLSVAIENARLLDHQIKITNRRNRIIDLYSYLGQQRSYQTMLREIPHEIRKALGFDRVTLALIEAGEIGIQSVSAAEDAIQPPPLESSAVEKGVLGQAIIQKETQFLGRQSLDTMATQDIRGRFPTDILALPLVVRDEVIGAIAMEASQPHELDTDEIETLKLMAAQLATSLENARLIEEMQQNLAQMDAIYRQQTAHGWDYLLKRHKGREDTEVIVGHQPAEGDIEQPGIETPLEVSGEVIGKLDLRGAKLGGWSQEDRAILEAVADEVSSRLEQVRLVEEINRRAAQLQTAAEIARSATGVLDLDTLLHRAVNLIKDQFGFYYVAVFLVSKDGSTANLREGTGEAGKRLKQNQHQLPVGSKSIIGYVSDRGERYIANQAGEDPYFWPNPILADTQAELGLPMKLGGQVIGVLDVQHNDINAFSDEDASVLQILADQIAIGIQNARLYQETLVRADREKAVVEITSKIRASRNLESMLKTTLLQMSQALGAKRGRIRLIPPDRRVKGIEEDR